MGGTAFPRNLSRGISANRDFLGQPGAHGEGTLHMAYITLVVRTTRDPGALVSTVKNTVWSLDRNLPISQVLTMDAVVADANASTAALRDATTRYIRCRRVGDGRGGNLWCYELFGFPAHARDWDSHFAWREPQRCVPARREAGHGHPALVGLAAGIAGALLLSRLMVKVLYRAGLLIQSLLPASLYC